MNSAQHPTRENVGSVVMFAFAVLGLFAAIALGIASVPLYVTVVEFGAPYFIVAAFALSLLTLAFAVANWLLFRRTQHRRYRLSFNLNRLSLGLVLVEFVGVIAFGH